jgi:hypothetical protein
MIAFLAFYFSNVSIVVELICLAGSFFLLKKKDPWAYFKIYLLYICSLELTGSIVKFYGYKNEGLFNINNIITPLFYCWMIVQSDEMKGARNFILKKTIPIYLLLVMINWVFIQGAEHLNTYSQLVRCILLIALSTLFFYRLIVSDDLKDIIKYDFFWLVSALIINALMMLIITVFRPFLVEYYKSAHINLYKYIQHTSNVFLYSFLLIAFYFHHKQNQIQGLKSLKRLY